MYGFRPVRFTQVIVVVALAALALLAQGGRAGAAAAPSAATSATQASGGPSTEWGWPLGHQASPLLGFGDTYGTGSQARTHSGLDLAGEEDEAVRSPVSATVSYVGQVPSGADRRVLTVTLETADGAKVSLMPLAGAIVGVGDRVSVGERIGALAADGDPSTGATHLHVGIRHGSLYVDPSDFLVAPAASPVRPPTSDRPTVEPATAPRAEVAPNRVTDPSHVPAPVAAPAHASPAEIPEVRAPEVRDTDRAEDRSRSPGHSTASASAGSAAAAFTAHTAATVAAARAAVQSGPSLITSLPTLMRALRTRDRLVSTAVSYLLATLAAAGSLAAVVKRASAPSLEEPTVASASMPGD